MFLEYGGDNPPQKEHTDTCCSDHSENPDWCLSLSLPPPPIHGARRMSQKSLLPSCCFKNQARSPLTCLSSSHLPLNYICFNKMFWDIGCSSVEGFEFSSPGPEKTEAMISFKKLQTGTGGSVAQRLEWKNHEFKAYLGFRVSARSAWTS